MKICTKCKNIKNLNEFHKRNESKDGLSTRCKTCCVDYNNSNKVIDAKNDEWYEDRELSRKQQKAKIAAEKRINRTSVEKEVESIKNKIKHINRSDLEKSNYNIYKRNYVKQRYQNDMNFRIKNILRSRLNAAIKNGQKTGSAVDDLGCSIEEFKRYIESKFEPWMTWDNWGKYDKNKKTWHIDHIDPLANFDLKNREELLKVCNYSNLRPLLASENLRKGNR